MDIKKTTLNTSPDENIRISDIIDDAQTYDTNDITKMNEAEQDKNPAPLTGKDNYDRIYSKTKGVSEDSESQDAGTPGMIGGDSDSD